MRPAEGDRVRSGTKRSHGTSNGTGTHHGGCPGTSRPPQPARTATPGPFGVVGQPCSARQLDRCNSTVLLRTQHAFGSSSLPSAARLGSVVTILLITAWSALLTPAHGLMNGYCASFQKEGDCPPCRLPLDSCTVRRNGSRRSLRHTKYFVKMFATV